LLTVANAILTRKTELRPADNLCRRFRFLATGLVCCPKAVANQKPHNEIDEQQEYPERHTGFFPTCSCITLGGTLAENAARRICVSSNKILQEMLVCYGSAAPPKRCG
jgi:hypothetical protein